MRTSDKTMLTIRTTDCLITISLHDNNNNNSYNNSKKVNGYNGNKVNSNVYNNNNGHN